MTSNLKTQNWLPRILRGAAVGTVGTVVIAATSLIVFWDADFYAARDKYEQWKLAFFGDWQPQNWCPPGRNSENCEEVSEFRAALEGAENFNFFRSLPVDGTDLTVITGVAFASALDVVSGAPSHLWCYINDGHGAVSRRITLAQVQAGHDPTFTNFRDLSGSDTPTLPLSAERLTALAQSHCQFTEFNSASS